MNGQEEKSGGLCEKQVRRILRRIAVMIIMTSAALQKRGDGAGGGSVHPQQGQGGGEQPHHRFLGGAGHQGIQEQLPAAGRAQDYLQARG